MNKARPRPPSEELLRGAFDKVGRYDAAALAGILDWSKQEIARFLETHPSTLSRQPASLKHQDPLAQLAAVMRQLLDQTGGDFAQARAWLRTPLPVLDRKSPKEVILSGRLDMVANLLAEIESGFAA
jgi:putative toxin-antitoxin system antitoxin component (TIGR02293 family)